MERPATVIVLAILAGCRAGDTAETSHPDSTPQDSQDSSEQLPPIRGLAAVAANAGNPFSALVSVTLDHEASVRVDYGETISYDHHTPQVDIEALRSSTQLVLGLGAARTYHLQVTAEAPGFAPWTSDDLTFNTDPLPKGWPSCSATFQAPESDFDPDEVVCTNADIDDDGPVYFCADRWGEPRWWLRHPDGLNLLAVRPLADGTWAAVSNSLDIFDASGVLIATYWPSWFEGRTRFVHEQINPHDILQLSDGPWAGALAFFTTTSESLEDWSPLGYGIIVYDPTSDEVLWDWSAHGVLGDGVPIDDALSYDRHGVADAENDWLHFNAILHEVDEDGRQYFWVSARSQDWIMKIDVQTDQILWRLGYGGDFTLVDDIDSTKPTREPSEGWFFHQHSPEWESRSGFRTRFFVFDNGDNRQDDEGSVLDGYSRAVEMEIDEDSKLAEIDFTYGSSDPKSPDHFYSTSFGDVNLMPGGERLLVTSGYSVDAFIRELAFPKGDLRWSLTCGGCTDCFYRGIWYPSLYDPISAKASSR
jgi:hypothetical protein